MTMLLMHYAIPCERLDNLVTVGIARIAIFAYRCGACSEDFHIDDKPIFCPFCGQRFTGEKPFGNRPL